MTSGRVTGHISSTGGCQDKAKDGRANVRRVTDVDRCVLVVANDAYTRKDWTTRFIKSGYSVEEVNSAAEALQRLHEKPFDAVLSELEMDRRDDGLVLGLIVRSRWGVPCIVYARSWNHDDSVLAADLGVEMSFASDPANSVEVVANVIRARQSLRTSSLLRMTPNSVRVRWERPIAKSRDMQHVLQKVAQVASEQLPVLITGETGVGKDVVAREIHRRSYTNRGPFVALNCGAIAEHLVESELFGHCRGAFTGAEANKPGLVQEADEGTLFLDEIADLSPKLQVTMLRFLERGEFRKVGETSVRKANVRVIAATNRSLDEAIASGCFREDLYYRIMAVNVHIPPLRERPEDIRDFTNVWRLLRASVTGLPVAVTAAALGRLENHLWPGNFRELEHVLNRAALEVRDGIVDDPHISLALHEGQRNVGTDTLCTADKRALRRAEARRALELAGGKKGEAARLIKRTRWTLRRWIKD